MNICCRTACFAIFLFMAGFTDAFASKGVEQPPGAVVGTGNGYKLTPDLSKARQTDSGQYIWTRRIDHPHASFLKLHIVDMNLRAGDQLAIRTDAGRIVETLRGLGPKDAGSFWALSVPGDSMVVEFQFAKPYSYPPFRIDQLIIGDRDLFAPAVEQGQRSICSPADFEDVVCYQDDADKWSNVSASVGIMTVGGNASTAILCSGSNVSPGNYVLTNFHCIENQSECNNAEFVFKYYRTGCNNNSPATPDWESFRCDEIVASEPFVGCDARPGELDFTLASMLGDAATTYGFVVPDPAPLVSGTDVYIVQHPSRRPHEITHGGGADFVVDGSVLRYYGTLDTEDGSSGSPIFRESDDRLVGLHHCGGCATAGVGNRGMAMSDIFPSIEPFLCSEEVSLLGAGSLAIIEVSGNGNTVVEPGEVWQFTPAVTNRSCNQAANEVTTQFGIGAESTAAVLLTDSSTFGTISAGQTVLGTAVQFAVSDAAVCGAEVVVDLVSISSSNSGTFFDQPEILFQSVGDNVTTTIYYEDFSLGLADWTVIDGGTGSGAAQTWTDTNPGLRNLSLTAPYVIADSDELGLGSEMDEQLISPVIDVTGYEALSLQFSHVFRWFNSNSDEQAEVDVRSTATDGVWVNIANYSGNDASGIVSLDISDYAASDLQIRFHYFNAAWEWYWAVDDIFIRGDIGFVCDAGPDTDLDGVADAADNCSQVANANQRDTNGDGFGNVCDADLNNDGLTNFADLQLIQAVFFSADDDADLNGDGSVNFADLSIVSDLFFRPPGPAGSLRR